MSLFVCVSLHFNLVAITMPDALVDALNCLMKLRAWVRSFVRECFQFYGSALVHAIMQPIQLHCLIINQSDASR